MKKLKQIFRFDNKKKVITTLSLLLMILVCIAASYSFFVLYVNNNNSAKINLNTGTLHLVFSDNDNGINAKLDFGNQVVKKFTIENIGTREASLSLDVKDLVNTYMNRSLTYNLAYSETENGEYTTIIPESNMPTSSTGLTQTIASELSVPAGDTYYYNLTIRLNDLDDVEQSSDLDATLNTKFQVSDPLKYRYYTLKIDPNGGTWGEFTTPQEYKLKNNETKTVSGTPTRVGEAFKGWKLEGVSSEFKNNKFTMGISDAVLTAEWTPNKYTLTIDPNGGEYSGDTTVSIGYQETLEIADPTRTGYTFAGWSVENGTLSNKTFTQSELKNSKLTASWTPIAYKYKVIHRWMNINGVGYYVLTQLNDTANYGEKITPQVTEYIGFTSPPAQTITISENEENNVVTYDYKRNQYTLTIQPNYGNYNGSTSNSTVKVYYNGTTNLKTPTRTGYTFGGWEVTNGTVNDDNVFTQSTASNATVKAKWVVNNYDYITYHRQMNIGGSTYTLKDTVTGNAAFGTTVKPPVKSYAGFTSPSVKSLTINTTGNTVDYNYTRNQYTLTYNFDNGQEGGPFTTTLYYGESITLGTPTKRGYTFNGWELVSGTGATLDSNTFTMGSSNASIKAKWQKNKYPVIEEIYLMNVDGSTYTLLSSIEVRDLSYGSTFSNNPSDKSGFTTPDAQTITVTDSTNYVRSYYTRNQYTLTINPNGGAYDGSSSYVTQTLYYEQQITLSTPVRDGYNFTSWSKTSGSLSGSRFEMSYRDATLTANYSPKQFTVTFNANGGVTPTGSKIVNYDSTYGELPMPTYAKHGFKGWYTAPSGGYSITENDKVLLTENQTLYAQWTDYLAEVNKTLTHLKITPTSGSPDFSQVSPSVGSYKSTSFGGVGVATVNVNNYYTYSSSYSFNQTTGKYTLSSVSRGKMSSICSNLVGKYLVDFKGVSSASYQTYSNLGRIYRITSCNITGNYPQVQYIDMQSTTYPNLNDKGKVYSMDDDYSTSYYYRGNVENNYVKFGKWTTGKYRGYGDTYTTSQNMASYIDTYWTCSSEIEHNQTIGTVSLINPKAFKIKDIPSGYYCAARDFWDNTQGTLDRYQNISKIYRINSFDVSTNVMNYTQIFPKRFRDQYYSNCDYSDYDFDCQSSPVNGKDMFWRIIRINGDGSLRLIYDGTQAWKNGTEAMDRFAFVGRFGWAGDASGVGYMSPNKTPTSTKDEAQRNEIDSTAKIDLENWYNENLIKYDEYISDTLFCNDRSTATEANVWAYNDTALGYGNNITYFGPYYRVNSLKTPSFKCVQKNDRFTVKDTYNGNGDLSRAIGLITADEALAAGLTQNQPTGLGNSVISNRGYYIYKLEDSAMWTMSPSYYGSYSYMSLISESNNQISDQYGGNRNYFAPVINIAPEYAQQMTGTGTATDPFVIPGVN